MTLACAVIGLACRASAACPGERRADTVPIGQDEVRTALSHFGKREFREALARFKEVRALSDTSGTRPYECDLTTQFYIARASEELGDVATALMLYEEVTAAKILPGDAAEEWTEKQKEAMTRIARVAVTVEFDGSDPVSAVTLEIDGASRRGTPRPGERFVVFSEQLILKGPRSVSVKADGYASEVRNVDLENERTVRLRSLELAPSPFQPATSKAAVFEDGAAAVARTDWEHARERFLSLTSPPDARVFFNLGVAATALRRPGEAYAWYDAATKARPGKAPAWVVDRAKSRRSDLAKQFARVALSVPSGARVTADERAIEVLPGTSNAWVSDRVPRALAKGTYEVAIPSEVRTLNLEGPCSTETDVELVEGQTMSVSLQCPSPTRWPAERVATVAAGGVAAAAGVTLLALALADRQEADSSCPNGECSESGWETAQTGRARGNWGTLFLGVGASALVVGVFVLDPGPAVTQQSGKSRARFSVRSFGSGGTTAWMR